MFQKKKKKKKKKRKIKNQQNLFYLQIMIFIQKKIFLININLQKGVVKVEKKIC